MKKILKVRKAVSGTRVLGIPVHEDGSPLLLDLSERASSVAPGRTKFGLTFPHDGDPAALIDLEWRWEGN